MTAKSRVTPTATVMIRIGSWFEARATGWGVLVVPLALLLLLAAEVLRRAAT